MAAGHAVAGEPAQPQAPSQSSIYEADFYAPFAPQSLLDMLERTPGFSLIEGNAIRGISGGGANVLIDGKRPATKADGFYESLRQIPVSHVARIELLRGGDVSEAPGFAIVANVLLRAEPAAAGSATLVIERAPHGRWFPNIAAAYAREAGDWRLSGSFGLDWEYHPQFGDFTLRDASGAVLERQRETFPGRYIDSAASGALSGPFAGGAVEAHLRYSGSDNKNNRTLSLLDDAGGVSPLSVLDGKDNVHSLEAGVDWSRKFADAWTFKLVTLATAAHSGNDQFETWSGGAAQSSLRQKPLEIVARTTIARTEGRFQPEFGGEIAFNRLHSRLRYFIDDGDGFEAIDLPAANIDAEEYRGEVFANSSMQLRPSTKLDFGLAAEVSELSVSGDARNTDRFFFLKPFAAITYAAAADVQWQIEARRTVSQLQFEDFAASVDASLDRPLGGNAQLRPASTWTVSLNHDRRHGKNAFTAKLWTNWQTDVLDYAPLDGGGQALSNVGDGRAWGASFKVTHPIGYVLRGGELTLEGAYAESRVADPLTGEKRRIANEDPTSFSAAFRQDIASWKSAWGISVAVNRAQRTYYVDETERRTQAPLWTAFAETTAFGGVKTRLELYDVAAQRLRTQRLFYAPDRAGAYAGSETRVQRYGGAYLILTLSRQF